MLSASLFATDLCPDFLAMNGSQENAGGLSSLRVVMLVLPIVRCDPSKPIPECGFCIAAGDGANTQELGRVLLKVHDLECLRVAFI